MTRSLLKFCVVFAGVFAGFPATARAQITEWPATVQPGHFLLEMDALSLTVDRDAGSKYTAVGAASTFLTTGLTGNWDIQLGAELFLSQKYDDGSFTERDSGIGDVYVRSKYRFYEDPDTGFSIAVLPYLKVPTNSGGVGNHNVEGGIIFPAAGKLWGDFQLYGMVELDYLRNDNNDGYDTFWYASAALNRQVTKTIGLYGEVTVGKSSGTSATEGTMGGGVTFAVSESTWWDFAVYRGVSSGASDWNQVLRFNWGF